MLSPKKVKFRRLHKGRRRGLAYKGNKLSFGEFGLKALTCGWVRAQQIEAARVAISRSVKKGGKIYIRIFPDKYHQLTLPLTRILEQIFCDPRL